MKKLIWLFCIIVVVMITLVAYFTLRKNKHPNYNGVAPTNSLNCLN